MDKVSIARIRVNVLEKEKLRIEKELERCKNIIKNDIKNVKTK
jgi:hypothetical protein